MSAKDVIIQQVASSRWLFEQFVKDLGPEDMKYQPCPGGNHALWILAHLAVSEDWLIGKLSGKSPQLSKELHDKYGGGSQPDPKDTLTKAQAWKLYADANQRTSEFVRSSDEARYADPAPEGMPPMLRTVGEVMGLFGTHPFWHFGQLTVNRRAMKKPGLLM